jgi:hypothetical protein
MNFSGTQTGSGEYDNLFYSEEMIDKARNEVRDSFFAEQADGYTNVPVIRSISYRNGKARIIRYINKDC